MKTGSLCWIAVLLSAVAAPGDEAEVRRRVIAEYSRALPRLRESLSGVSGEATLKIYKKSATPGPVAKESVTPERSPGSDPPTEPDLTLLETTEVAFAFNGLLRKMTRRRSRPSQPAHDPNVEMTYGVGPRYSFILKRAAAGKPPVLTSLHKDINLGTTFRVTLDQYLFSPFAIGSVPMAEIMADPSFSVERVSELELDGRRLYKIEYRYDPKSKNALRSGWIMVAPDLDWAIVRWACSTRNSEMKYSGSVEYRGRDDRPPRPSKIVFETPTARRVLTIDRLELSPLPEREFTLAAFGLPDLEGPSDRSHASRASYWFFGSALAALLVALTLKYLASRPRQPAPSEAR